MPIEATENLFSYGTLQEENVQLSTFGRKLEGSLDILAGHIIALIPIQDQSIAASSGATHYRNIEFTGLTSDLIKGTVFKVTKKELEEADIYEEVASYRRQQVQLSSGLTAWVYLYFPSYRASHLSE